jgi:predicted enzyme related to lactoylglutathione lyase
MLRGMSTINLWAEDLSAAARWYKELLGVEPYFTSEAAGRGPGYVEFRIGDYQHELGIVDRRFAPPELAAGPGGAVVYWHVDDVARTLDRLVSWVPSNSGLSPSAAPGSSPPRSSNPSATS